MARTFEVVEYIKGSGDSWMPPPSTNTTNEKATTSFKSLGLSQDGLLKLVGEHFKKPTQVQQEAIPQFLQGKDLLIKSRTGTGKTAAYGLPLLDKLLYKKREKVVKAVILVPTRELAQQVLNQLEKFIPSRSKLAVLNLNTLALKEGEPLQ